MENSEFAQVFREIAELLELKNDNPFKIRAYQKAAQNIENLTKDLAELYHHGGLKELEAISGIGSHIAAKIEELIATGKQKDHQKLLKEFPRPFIEMMRVPGIGPKTALRLKKKLKIDSVEKLITATEKGLLIKLPGFKEKKIANIKKGLELKEKVKGRFLLSQADQYVNLLVKQLKELKEIDQLLPAGSYRRGQETIGDLDLLVTTRKPEPVMKFFTTLPQVAQVLSHGPTRSSVILRNGIQADLRVVQPKQFGSAAHYFTGNKQHNIMIRELAQKKELKVSEYGVFRGEQWLAGRTEEELFKKLGLAYIPPELRQGTNELELAKKRKLPKLIERADIRGDLQMHSIYSDGSNTIEQLAIKAKALGYEYIAITDHTKSTRVAKGQTEKEIIKELAEIDKLNGRLEGLRVLKGAEVDILPDGTLDFPDSVLKILDVVIAAVHSNFKMDKKTMTARIVKALQNKYVNLLSHPTGRLIGERDPYEVDLEEIFKVAKESGTYLEINAQPTRLDLSDVHCRRAKELGILMAIDTDTHSAAGLEMIKYGVLTARRGGLEKEDIINTLPIAKLLKVLYAKRS
jgi:DNA polymerase (family 10)